MRSTAAKKSNYWEKKWLTQAEGGCFFTLFIGGEALGTYFLSEYTFHLYDTTSIDSVTHGLSAMGVTAIVLNFIIIKKGTYYFPISIGVAWMAFIVWDVYEWMSVSVYGSSGFIQTKPLDMVVDLWVDTLGSLAVCFIYRVYRLNDTRNRFVQLFIW